LSIGKVEVGLEVADKALSIEGTMPVPGAPGVVIEAGSSQDHTEQKCQGKIDVGSSSHGAV
jgi:hypothetical protein